MSGKLRRDHYHLTRSLSRNHLIKNLTRNHLTKNLSKNPLTKILPMEHIFQYRLRRIPPVLYLSTVRGNHLINRRLTRHRYPLTKSLSRNRLTKILPMEHLVTTRDHYHMSKRPLRRGRIIIQNELICFSMCSFWFISISKKINVIYDNL